MPQRISTSAFTLDWSARGDQEVVLSLQGELDLSVAIETRQLVEDALRQAQDVIIDLAGVEFVDSTGLATLLRAKEFADSAGRRLRIAGPVQVQVRRVLRITGLEQALAIDREAGEG
ncbi:STAS domain-containing protein [Conexibacter sp. DBS9H8]|uniref:STAS domain-containing protein n=1 Tax=Conexibacter sp. DBS9H8 TaxID=2937801 RepID=UPI00200DFB29|nr:STAS domain-containing protein [Conexibacter sp. DBS9H8]